MKWNKKGILRVLKLINLYFEVSKTYVCHHQTSSWIGVLILCEINFFISYNLNTGNDTFI